MKKKIRSFSHRNIQTDPDAWVMVRVPQRVQLLRVSQEPHGGSTWEGVPRHLTLCIFRVMYWQRAFRAYVIWFRPNQPQQGGISDFKRFLQRIHKLNPSNIIRDVVREPKSTDTCPIPSKNSSSATPRAESYDSLIGSDSGYQHQIIRKTIWNMDMHLLPGMMNLSQAVYFALLYQLTRLRSHFNHSKLV